MGGSGFTILFGLIGLVFIAITVYIIATVLPDHWRRRKWSFVVIDVLLVLGALIIAARPVGDAAQAVYRSVTGRG